MRYSTNTVKDGRLINGFDYEVQAWVENGKYVSCGHPPYFDCHCYGKMNEGKETESKEDQIISIKER